LEEIEEAVDDSIGQGGLLIFSHVCHFILIAHPCIYNADRFSEEEERDVVHTATLNAGYKFPVCGPENATNLEDGFHVFTYQPATERMPEHREYYRVRRNGLFVLTRISPDDIDEKRQYRAVEPYLGFATLVTTATKMLAFAAALARGYGEDTSASIIVSGLANHKLVDDLEDGSLAINNIKAAYQNTVRTDFVGGPATFARERVDWTAKVIARCLRALNFPETTNVAQRTVRQYIERVR
jgi:hypothetical protein